MPGSRPPVRSWLGAVALSMVLAAAPTSAHPQSGAGGATCDSYSAFDDLALRTPIWLQVLVERLAPEYNLDPNLVLAVIAVESNFSAKAQSHKNAQGLMQLIPATAERFGVEDPFNPHQNVQGGMKYLRWLLGYFKGDMTRALAGYNAGEGAVRKYDGVPPYRETRNYVEKVSRLYNCNRTDEPVEAAATAPAVSESDVDRIRSVLLAVIQLDDPLTGNLPIVDAAQGCASGGGIVALDVSQLSAVSPGGSGVSPCR